MHSQAGFNFGMPASKPAAPPAKAEDGSKPADKEGGTGAAQMASKGDLGEGRATADAGSSVGGRPNDDVDDDDEDMYKFDKPKPKIDASKWIAPAGREMNSMDAVCASTINLNDTASLLSMLFVKEICCCYCCRCRCCR